MRLTNQEDLCVQDCIKQLLSDHIAQPFALLREAGVVAELRSSLKHSPSFGMVPPTFVQFPGREKPCRVNRTGIKTDVHRVQMEIQMPLSGHGFCHESFSDAGPFPTTKILDLALLSPSPTLYCARNGAGDVVQQVDLTSVSAAIEVKASPSLTPEQRGHYVKDIWALLELALQGIASYFVIIDKTSTLYGDPAHALTSGQAFEWDTKRLQEILVRRGPYGDFPFASLRDARIEISTQQPEDPYVQVWTIERSGNGYVPRRFFATAISVPQIPV